MKDTGFPVFISVPAPSQQLINKWLISITANEYLLIWVELMPLTKNIPISNQRLLFFLTLLESLKEIGSWSHFLNLHFLLLLLMFLSLLLLFCCLSLIHLPYHFLILFLNLFPQLSLLVCQAFCLVLLLICLQLPLLCNLCQ